VTLAELQERLLAWASAEPRQDWILAARQQHFALHGEPHEEDQSFEARMNGLLDAFVYAFRPNGVDTTLELFLRDGAADLTTDERAAVREMARGVHGLFEVRRIRPGEIRVRDVFTGEEHDVGERRSAAGLEKGDLIEARLLPHGGRLHFSAAFLFHPRPVRKRILGEAKRRLKAAGKGGQPDVEAFLATLSRMALKLERYRNVRVESIYDFEQPAHTPRPGEGR
jgi:hypothetical protein